MKKLLLLLLIQFHVLAQFGGLELHEAEVDPALRAHFHRADEFDEDEEDERHAVAHRRDIPPEPNGHHGDNEHRGDPQAEALHLGGGPRREITTRDRVEHHEAHRGDGAEEDDQGPVQEQDLARAGGDGFDGIF